MKNKCPKCGRPAAGVVQTKHNKYRTLYTFFHVADNEDGCAFDECKFAAKRKKKEPKGNL